MIWRASPAESYSLPSEKIDIKAQRLDGAALLFCPDASVKRRSPRCVATGASSFAYEGERWELNPRMVESQSTALTTWRRSPFKRSLS